MHKTEIERYKQHIRYLCNDEFITINRFIVLQFRGSCFWETRIQRSHKRCKKRTYIGSWGRATRNSGAVPENKPEIRGGGGSKRRACDETEALQIVRKTSLLSKIVRRKSVIFNDLEKASNSSAIFCSSLIQMHKSDKSNISRVICELSHETRLDLFTQSMVRILLSTKNK